MRILRNILLAAALGFAASLWSSAVTGSVPGQCPNILTTRPCQLAAVGWPIPYVVDSPGIAVEGVVNLSTAGTEDTFVASAWTIDMVFWSAMFAVLLYVAARIRRRGQA